MLSHRSRERIWGVLGMAIIIGLPSLALWILIHFIRKHW
jgi:hypothetical protein